MAHFGPLNLSGCHKNLSFLGGDPVSHIGVFFDSSGLVVVGVDYSEKPLNGFFHPDYELSEPFFTTLVHFKFALVSAYIEFNHFFMVDSDDGFNIELVVGVLGKSFILQRINSTKDFIQVGVQRLRVLAHTNDLKQVVISQEVEPREFTSFGIQELNQTLVDGFKLTIHFL
jgi:hypothetical protein